MYSWSYEKKSLEEGTGDVRGQKQSLYLTEILT